MNESQAIVEELRKLSRLLALRQIENLSRAEQASVLSSCGFSNKEAAALIGTTEGSIRASLSNSRKRAVADDKA